jgi:hypothetical protein
MPKCLWCDGNILEDRCLQCGRSDNYEHEIYIKNSIEKFEKGELEAIDPPINKNRQRKEYYAHIKIKITNKMWKELKTPEIAEIMGCSPSWVSHLKPRKYRRKYQLRNGK